MTPSQSKVFSTAVPLVAARLGNTSNATAEGDGRVFEKRVPLVRAK